MPVRKKGNKKNVPQHKLDDTIVPKEGDEIRRKPIPEKAGYKETARVTANSASGKRKRPK